MAPPSYNAGQLRHSIRFERRRTENDGMGNMVGSWRTLVSGVRAKVANTRGGEDVRAARLTGISTFDIVVRSSDALRDVTTADRIVDERTGQSFNIQWIGNLDEKDRWLTITCLAGGVDG